MRNKEEQLDWNSTRKTNGDAFRLHRIGILKRLLTRLPAVTASVLGQHFADWHYATPGLLIIGYGPKPQLKIGKYVSGVIYLYCWDKAGRLLVGNYTSLNTIEVMIGGAHHFDVTTYFFKENFLGAAEPSKRTKSEEVYIGSDVWVGKEAMIMDGASVGDGAVIGARSVVSGRIEPYSISAGAPAKRIRYRFEEEQITALLMSKWWDLDPSVLLARVDLLYSKRVEEFVSFVQEAKHCLVHSQK